MYLLHWLKVTLSGALQHLLNFTGYRRSFISMEDAGVLKYYKLDLRSAHCSFRKCQFLLVSADSCIQHKDE